MTYSRIQKTNRQDFQAHDMNTSCTVVSCRASLMQNFLSLDKDDVIQTHVPVFFCINSLWCADRLRSASPSRRCASIACGSGGGCHPSTDAFRVSGAGRSSSAAPNPLRASPLTPALLLQSASRIDAGNAYVALSSIVAGRRKGFESTW